MKRAKSIGSVEIAVSRTPSGKVRARLMFSIEQLEAMLEAARNGDVDDDDRDEARAKSEPVAPAEEPPKRVFVFEGTKAWDAWLAYKKRTTGRDWDLKTKSEDGKRTGWGFPSLFPPSATGPPSHLTEEDEREQANLK